MRPLYCAVLLLSAACAANAQEADATLKFEVASIKVSANLTDAEARTVVNPGPEPGRLTLRNVTLSALIHTAYRLKSYDYIGPSYTERFDVMAKVREGTSATPAQQ